MDLVKDVREFHEKFGLPFPEKPRQLTMEEYNFRSRFMMEEYKEYLHGFTENNLPDQLDALVDLVYVVLGTAHFHGFDFGEAWKRVHAANMAKVRASDAGESKRGTQLDIVKPEGWVAPDLSDLV